MKTASTSIEIALSKICGPKDIITPISPEDEEIRRSLGYPGPQNFLSPLDKSYVFYNHMPAKEVKILLGEEKWSGYYKFCFERNIYDRVISFYYWHNKSEPRPSLSDFIRTDKAALLRLRKYGYDLYTIDEKVVVDKLCKFENLTDDLETVKMNVGITCNLELPSAKSKYRKDLRSYQDILSSEDKANIKLLFSKEINLLGYE